MGYIDSAKYTLSCPRCGTTESASVLEKGSCWGSSWQEGVSFAMFDTQWNGGGKCEPTLTSATCKKCSIAAHVKSEYGG